MRISRRSPLSAVLGLSLVLFAAPVWANCTASRGVGAVEAAVGSLMQAPNSAASEDAIQRLDLVIDSLAIDGAGNGLGAYLASRRRALDLYRSGDIRGAQVLFTDAGVRQAARRVVASAGEDCFEATDTEAPSIAASGASIGTGGGAASDRGPGGGLALGDQVAGAARSIDWGEVQWTGTVAEGRFIAPLIGALTLLTFCGAIYALFSDRRREPRYLCYLPVEISRAGRKLATAMVDVNRTGARVVIEGEPVKPGDPVAISVDGRLRPAVVIWEKQGRAGVRFKEALGGRDLRHIEAMARAGAGFERV